MGFVSRLSLKKKLMAGFGSVALLTLMVGVVGYISIRSLRTKTDQIACELLPSVEALLDMRFSAQQIRTAQRTLMNPYLETKDFKEQAKIVDKAKASAQEAFKKYDALGKNSDEEATWKEFGKSWTEWLAAGDEFMQAGRDVEAFLVDASTDNTDSSSYLEGIRQAQGAQASAELNFKNQVRAWKNLLLRGYVAKDYEVAWNEFQTCETQVRKEAEQIELAMRKNGMDTQAVKEFMKMSTELNAAYREALKKFDPAAPESVRVVDKLLRGADRPVEEKIESLRVSLTKAEAKATDAYKRLDAISLGKLRAAGNKVQDGLQKLADVNAEEATTAGQEATAVATTATSVTVTVALVSLALAMGLGFVMSRSISNPIVQGMNFAETLAKGDLTHSITSTRQDEVGQLVTSLNGMGGHLRQMMTEIGQCSRTLSSSSTELSATATQLAGGAEETTNQSAQVAAAAEQMSTNMGNMAAATEEMSTNIKVVASAVEELTASISEVAKSAEKAAGVASDAAELAATSNTQIGDLGNAADEIGKVIEVIQDIAEQTNLLALNATIEAARAGDAGKGFAVVASEVKELAKQTGAATEDIRKRIEGIQGSTGRAVKSIGDISLIIQSVNELSRTIASAVEEQSITTREIAKNVTQSSTAAQTVARGVAESASASQEITRTIVGVDQAAKQSAQGAAQTETAGRELSRMAEQFQTLVGQFTV